MPNSIDLSRLTAHPEVLERMGWDQDDGGWCIHPWDGNKRRLEFATPDDRSTAIGVMVEMLDRVALYRAIGKTTPSSDLFHVLCDAMDASKTERKAAFQRAKKNCMEQYGKVLDRLAEGDGDAV